MLSSKGVKIILKLVLGVFAILFALVLTVRIPQVQAFLADKITSYVHQKTGFQTEINHIYISWFDEIELEGLIVNDLSDGLMVSTGVVKADLDLGALLVKQLILFNDISVAKGELYLTKYKGESEINLIKFLRLLNGSNPTPRKPKKNLSINIGGIKLDSVNFQYNDYNRKKKIDQVDFSHLTINNIIAEVEYVKIDSGLISIKVDGLTCTVDKLAEIKKLNSLVEFDLEGLHLNELNLETAASKVSGDINFLYDSLSALNYFTEKVNIDANIEESNLNIGELSALFNLPDTPIRESVSLQGEIFGKIGSLQGRDVSFSIADLINFKANLFVLGLPVISETFLDIDFQEANINLQELFYELGNRSIQFPESINQLNYKGEFTGFLSDFVTKGNFRTKAGDLYTDVNLKIKDYPTTTAYEGFVSTGGFDIGSIVGDTTLFQKIALTGSLNGNGLTVESADFFLKSDVKSAGINGYEYINLATDGEFKSQFFNGKLLVNDPNLQLKIDGRIDLSDKKEIIEAFIEVDSVNLQNIKLTQENIIISAKSKLEIQGFDIDKVTGNAVIKDFYLRRNGQEMNLDSLTLEIRQVNENKIIDLFSNQVEAQLSGDFKLSQVGADIKNIGQELLLELENDSSKLSNYYADKKSVDKDAYSMQFFVKVQDPNLFLRPFYQDIYLSKQLEAYGGLYHGDKIDLSLNLLLDSIYYEGNAMTNNFVSVSLAKESEISKVTGQGEVFSDQQYWNDQIETETLATTLSWNENKIKFNLAAKRLDSLNAVDVSGTVTFVKDSTIMSFDSSNVKLDNHIFHFSKGNQMVILNQTDKKGVTISDLILTDGSQFLSLEGFYGESADLDIMVGNLDVINLNALMKRNLAGTANGFVNFKKEKSGSYFTGELKIDELYFDQFLVGDISANTSWDKYGKKLQIDFNIFRKGINAIKIIGDIGLNNGEKSLDLDASFDGAQIALLTPYLTGVASNLNGDVTGKFHVTGSLDYPIINGAAKLEKGTVLIDYLKTEYQYEGTFEFSQDIISFQKIEFVDFKGNKAFSSGNITHNGFKNLLIDVEIDLFNFNVLNTNQKDNQLFYGEAYTTGKSTIYGTPRNIKISANASTNKNTKIFVPLSEETNTNVKEYITFVDFSDTLNINKVIEEEINLKGVELDFTIDVTPDAYFELIFDIKSGDIIRGRGDGDIKLTVNTEGDFSMFGDYEIKEGGYNFTLYNIINKEFIINPGSRISWYGDPYKAILAIEANYSQVVSIAQLTNDPTSNARAKSIVKLFLDGEMLEPEINFDIDFEDYRLDQSVFIDAFKSSIKADQQKLNRQVFSLLILKRLFDTNANFVASQAIGVSVSEFVSNQLSYWITQVDDNLEVDVDISSLDADAFNAFRLRLSYKFLDGRLRISRGGGFGTVTPNGQEADPNKIGNIIGDITLEYLLTPDGKLRVKMFTRNNQNVLEDDNAFETGASIRYVRSFDYLKEIWLKSQVKKVKFVDADGNEVNKPSN